jgi:protein-S-isoprenylcysteine O-methyltransferase Ste14
MTSDPKDKPKRHDLIERGSYRSTPLGTALFIFLRALDVPLQSYILFRTFIPPASLLNPNVNDLVPVFRTALLGMSTGAMLKQNVWVLFLSGDPMPAPAALMVGIFNGMNDSIATLLFNYFPPDPNSLVTKLRLVTGVSLFSIGILLEFVSEAQRKRFKSDPNNKGKLHTTGLFGLARHINYGGYTLWRTGLALVGGGPLWGIATFSFFFYDFLNRAIPVLDGYCGGRYGEQWEKYKKEVKWRILPGVM